MTIPATIEEVDSELRIGGDLTMQTVTALSAAGSDLVRQGARVIDLSGVQKVDSAAIALLLEWLRTAGEALKVSGAPIGLVELARLYSVSDILLLQPRPTPAA